MGKPVRPRFFKPSAAVKRPQRDVTLTIARLSDEGRGIAFAEGKTWFVAGALPGETVRARATREKRDHAEAQLLTVEAAAADRIVPRCPVFGRCGGCQLQMLGYEKQLAHKQLTLEKLLAPFTPTWEAPLTATPWHYRHRARLSVAEHNGLPQVGFKAMASHRVIAAPHCDVIDERLLPLLQWLPQWLALLKQWRRIEEIAISVDAHGRLAIDCQGKSALPVAERELLQQLCAVQGVSYGGSTMLFYPLPSQRTGFEYTLRDFTQVNPAINDQMVTRALHWLQPDAGSRVVDLFCGLGNFTLPMAKHAGQVTGIEGSAAMVERARANALAAGLDNTSFVAADLFEPDTGSWPTCDLALLDPPRAGARAVCEILARSRQLQRIVYVSCNPQTLTRDLGLLVAGGFQVERAALVDMFPQSGHSEAMVCLGRV